MQATTFSIREARVEDIPAARALMIRIFEEDFGTGYVPAHHWDVDDIASTYIYPPHNVLFVAVDDDSGEIVGTGGVRDGALKPGVSPSELVERYEVSPSAQLVRMYVAAEHRRRGIARALVNATLRFIASDGSRSVIALHAYRHSPGAVEFWAAIGAEIVVDDPSRGEIFYEIPMERAQAIAAG